ncbi:transcription factor IIA [Phlyctema vagabunda]|uniref:Transcription factor IIA n=1 Tax=Phlyctema vagabunda TaxID=108571 RepID=A0ABR4PP31_9HELO
MSNNQVGVVYQQIIADVVESSRVDFEEGGVDERVLEELRQGWQQKLSQLGVATFPWDPKPDPPATVLNNQPTIPSNTGNYQANNAGNQSQQQAQQLSQMNSGPRVKSEPGLENQGMSQAQFQAPPQALAGMSAPERAAANLEAAYGPRAAASIEQIRSSAPASQTPQGQPQQMAQQMYQQQMQQQQQRAMQGGAQQGQRPPLTEQQMAHYRAQQAANAQQQMQRINQNGVNGAQTDGGGDDVEAVGVVKRFNAQGEEEMMGRVEIDNLLHAKIQAMGQSMEGGGLMLPLKQASKAGKSRERKVKPAGVGQNDGGDDDDDGLKDEELDEDAINSDLDDPDDGLNDDEDEEDGMGHIMLCMYDKVQRVKNKWKCVMKDGVLTVNGKEYVFHKASGEYEW